MKQLSEQIHQHWGWRADLQDVLPAAQLHPARNDLAKGVCVAQVLGSAIPPRVQAAVAGDRCSAMICRAGILHVSGRQRRCSNDLS